MENQGRSSRQQSNNEGIAYIAVIGFLVIVAMVVLNTILSL